MSCAVWRTPFPPSAQILDVEGLTEDCQCLCTAEPVGFTLAEGEDGGPGKLSATVMLHLRAWRPYELNCVADAFSTQCEVQCETAPLTAETLACTLDQTVEVNCSGPLPDQDTRLLACFASFGPVSIETRDQGPVLTARVLVTAFGQNSLDEIDSYDKTAELVLPLSGCPAGELWPECWLSAESLQAGCTGGALEVTVQVRRRRHLHWGGGAGAQRQKHVHPAVHAAAGAARLGGRRRPRPRPG